MQTCTDEITDAWVEMSDARLMERLQPELVALGITDVFETPIPEALRLLDPSRLQTAPEEERKSSLLQQLALRLATTKDGRLAAFANDWAAALLRFNIAACDRPHVGAAQLVGLLSQPETTIGTFRDRL